MENRRNFRRLDETTVTEPMLIEPIASAPIRFPRTFAPRESHKA